MKNMKDLDGFGAMHPAAVPVVFRKNYALRGNQRISLSVPNRSPSPVVLYHGFGDAVSEPVAMKPSAR